jgi:hypothetical protein
MCVTTEAQEEKAHEDRHRLFFELKGESKVSGVTDLTTLPVKTPFARMDLKIGVISTITFDADGNASLSLKNGDRLKGNIAADAISIEAAFGDAKIAVTQIKRMSVLPTGAMPGLLLWNRLDGGRSIHGPDVEFLQKEGFVDAKSGKGVQVAGNNTHGFRAPADIVKDAKKGTLEFWMKVVKKPTTVSHGNGPTYGMVTGCKLSAQYNANDGGAHGKFAISSAGYFVYTERYSGSKSTDLLGKEGEWNHYAIIWDWDGIEGMNAEKMAFLINGKPHGTYQAGPANKGPILAGANTTHIMFHQNRNAFAGVMVYDELKIWDHAVTDFSRSSRMLPVAADNGPRRVAIDVLDGSHILGTLAMEEITLTTKDLGKVSIPVRHLSELKLDENRKQGVLLLGAGDELVGTIETPSLHVQTLFGKIEIAMTRVSRMTATD